MKKKNRLYFDVNSTTPEIWGQNKIKIPFGNPSSLYYEGQEAKICLESARSKLSECLECEASQLIFTSSATEANNQVLFSALFKQLQDKKKKHILISEIEHSSILKTALFLKTLDLEIDFVPVDKFGIIQLQTLKKYMNMLKMKLILLIFF